MLNLKGAFVVVGNASVTAHVLPDTAYGLYMDRIAVVGFDKATAYTFGNDALYALPCTAECMEHIALNYMGINQEATRALCAVIALGKPIPNGSDSGPKGGLGILADHAKPKAPKGSGGATVKPAMVQAR